MPPPPLFLACVPRSLASKPRLLHIITFLMSAVTAPDVLSTPRTPVNMPSEHLPNWATERDGEFRGLTEAFRLLLSFVLRPPYPALSL